MSLKNIPDESEELLQQMTTEEKWGLCLGKNVWYLGGIDRLNIPKIEMRDGPHGLRRGQSKCYPNLCLTACSWDRELLFDLGVSLAKDFLKEQVNVILGPGINIKRIPNCGRNFEYLSEDPLLTGELAAELVKGIQSQGIIACVKHFCCYNQEQNRFSYSSEVDEVTLREIYLKAFEIVIEKAEPGMLMTSYNRLNGTYTAQNTKLIQNILRKEWGYEGVVVSDWGGADRRAESFKAGLDLDMPGCGTIPDDLLQSMDHDKTTEIDEHCQRILNLINRIGKVGSRKNEKETISLRRAAAESMILLKNEDKVLPLQKSDKIAVIGRFAKYPRIQGGGCANVQAELKSSPFDEIAKRAADIPYYASGYGEGEESKLFEEAQAVAAVADKVIVFAGLEEDAESEAYDRANLLLSPKQIRLIECVSAVNKNVVVVLFNGGVVEMASWKSNVAGIIEAYYAGQETGGAVSDVLFGVVNPSGRLAETIPLRLEDTPAYLYYPGQNDKAYYGERMFVGYRYYVSKKQPVAFPFGFGLSYSTFEYEDLILSQSIVQTGDTLTVNVTVKNVGDYAGKEVTQIYLADENNGGYPSLQLVDFQKTELQPAECKKLVFHLSDRIFRHFDTDQGCYILKQGNYRICLCKNCEEEIISFPVTVLAESKAFRINRYTKIGEILQQKGGDAFCNKYLAAAVKKAVYDDDSVIVRFENSDVEGDEFCRNLVKSLPLRALISLSGGIMTEEKLTEMIKIYNDNAERVCLKRIID